MEGNGVQRLLCLGLLDVRPSHTPGRNLLELHGHRQVDLELPLRHAPGTHHHEYQRLNKKDEDKASQMHI